MPHVPREAAMNPRIICVCGTTVRYAETFEQAERMARNGGGFVAVEVRIEQGQAESQLEKGGE
jgi:hypothetical protein